MKYFKWISLAVACVFMLSFNSPGYKIGDIAADFYLKNVDGNMVSLRNYTDAKGFIVIFTCNHCPYSKAYEERINALNRKFAPEGFPVIAINPNNPDVQPEDSYDKMIERSREKNFTFPYLIDEGQQVYPKYGATKTPHVYVLLKTPKGPEVKYIGAIDDNHADPKQVKTHFVRDAVNALIEGREIEIKETKAIGCSIKV